MDSLLYQPHWAVYKYTSRLETPLLTIKYTDGKLGSNGVLYAETPLLIFKYVCRRQLLVAFYTVQYSMYSSYVLAPACFLSDWLIHWSCRRERYIICALSINEQNKECMLTSTSTIPLLTETGTVESSTGCGFIALCCEVVWSSTQLPPWYSFCPSFTSVM